MAPCSSSGTARDRCISRDAYEKQRLLAEADALPHGEQGAWLRRNGLYAAQLSQWRKALAEQGTQGLEPKRGGRQPADPRDREIERLRRENARLERRAQVAEDLVALQKKLSDLLEQVRSEPAP
jgi:transposase-like protein